MTTNIQLLRSSVAYKRPSAAPLLEGQVALNFNATEPGLFFRLTNGQLSKVGPVAFTDDGTAPNFAPAGETGNSVGEEWMNAQPSLYRPILHIYDGNAWQTASGFKVDYATGNFKLERTLEVDGLISNDVTFNGGIEVGGNITPNGQNCAYYLGKPDERWDVAYLCNADVGRNVDIGGSLTVGGIATFEGNAKFLSYIDSGLIPLGANNYLGTTSDRWKLVGAVDADFSGNLTVGGTSEFNGRIISHLIPSGDWALGAPSSPWTDVYTKNANISQDLVVGSNLTVNGSVTSNLVPGGDFNLGSAANRWDYGYFKNLDASASFKCSGVVTDNFKPDGGARLLGTSSNRWNNVYTGNLNSNGVATLSGDINSSGKFSAHAIPKVNNTYDLGSTSLRWRKLWLVNGDVSGQVKAPSASSPTDGDYLVNKDYVDSEIGKLSGYWTKSGSNLSPTSANTHLVKNGSANLGTTASRWDNAYTVGTNTNILVVNTSVNSSLVPNGSGTIGTSGTRWSHIYGTTITANTWSGGTVTGNFVPNSNNSRSLGNDSNRWASLYSVNVTTTNLSGCTVTGHVVPNSNNSKNLGSSGARWNNIYGNVLDFTVATGFELRGDITVDGNNSRNLGTSSNRLANVYAVTTNTQNLSGCTVKGNVIPDGNNTRDLGSTSNRWKNLYTNDLHLANERGDWTIIEEEEYLSIKNNKNGKMYKFVLQEIEG